jgi:hypothetical protein
MKPFQIFVKIGFKVLDRHLIDSARPSIGANTLPRKLQVLA